MKFLDIDGVSRLWEKVKSTFLPLNGRGASEVKIIDYDSIIFQPNNEPASINLEITKTMPEYVTGLGNHQINLILNNAAAPNTLVMNVQGIGNRSNVERNFVYRTWESIIQGDTAITTEKLNEVLV